MLKIYCLVAGRMTLPLILSGPLRPYHNHWPLRPSYHINKLRALSCLSTSVALSWVRCVRGSGAILPVTAKSVIKITVNLLALLLKCNHHLYSQERRPATSGPTSVLWCGTAQVLGCTAPLSVQHPRYLCTATIPRHMSPQNSSWRNTIPRPCISKCTT